MKSVLKEQKELIVNTIESIKNGIPINRVFNISRSAFENYKSIVIHKCNAPYFKWYIKRFSNQLSPTEVETIKRYMTNVDYKF